MHPAFVPLIPTVIFKYFQHGKPYPSPRSPCQPRYRLAAFHLVATELNSTRRNFFRFRLLRRRNWLDHDISLKSSPARVLAKQSLACRHYQVELGNEQKKKKHKQEHRKAFERLAEIQQIAYTNAMARDAQAWNERDFDPDDLESDYYRKIYNIEQKKSAIHATRALENWVPLIAALGGMIISAMLLFKGLKHMDLGLTTLHNYLIMGMVGASIWMATFIFAKTLKGEDLNKSTFLMFSWMQVFTASGFAFSHGSNDIANAIGPFAAILDVLRTGEVASSAAVPTIAMVTFGVALIVGLWFIGKEVIQTVGHNLTKMHPSSGFSAELAAASVVMLASLLGLPVSSTHILIGSVLGVGMVNRSTNWGDRKSVV